MVSVAKFARHHWQVNGRVIAESVLCICLSLCLVYNLTTGEAQEFFDEVVSRITLLIIAQNVVAIMLYNGVHFALYRVHSLFRWSWPARCFGWKSTNMNTMPLEKNWLGLAFGVLLIFNVPGLAAIEELLFRQGLADWSNAIGWSVMFGFIHIIAGVPVSVCCALVLAGLWYSAQYFNGGLLGATVHHTTSNELFILLLLVIRFRTDTRLAIQSMLKRLGVPDSDGTA